MIGDLEREPVEGGDPLDDLADALVPDDGEERDAAEAGDDAEDEQEEVEDSGEEEEEEAEEEAEDDPTVKLKHDGKEVEVKLSEAINLAQQGMDYTKKTMAVAEERKAVEAERARIAEHRAEAEKAQNESLARLEAFSKFMESQVGQPPDPSMLSSNTAGYIAAKEQYEARKGQLHQAYAAQQQIRDEQARQRQAWIAERAEATDKALRDTLPGWGDDVMNELAKFAGGLGLTPQNAETAMLEPGFWTLLHKAKAYDAIQDKKASMKPTEKLAKVVKPSANNTSSKVAARAKREAEFNKNPSVDSLAEFI